MQLNKFKKTALSLSLILAAFMSPMTALAASEWTMQSPGVYQMLDGSSLSGVVSRGIDISHYQGTVDWDKIAADDVKFVMHGTRYKGKEDPVIRRNLTEADKRGIKLGVYIYSYAMTVAEAEAEADFVLNIIKDFPISYPVAFDVEDSNTQGKLPKAELTAIIKAFCNKIEAAGYYPILYANDYWIANKLDMNALKKYDIWVARYNVKHSYPNPVMWQATSTGRVSGIGGNVDIDFQYKSFNDKIPTDTWRTIAGKNYYFKDYTMVKNAWVNDGGKKYYMNEDGIAKTGWFTDKNTSYYLDNTGAAKTGWYQENGIWYYFDSSDASLKTGWFTDKNTSYYSDKDGKMQTGWLVDGNNTYFLSPSGAAKTGWVNDGNVWYYMDNTGKMQTGWVNSGNSWYYMDSVGKMQTGWADISNARYFLNPSGAMATGWLNDAGSWYYMNGSGAMKTGWVNDAGAWYYMDNAGRMQTGWAELSGKKYFLNPSGAMATGWVNDAGSWYYMDSSGAMSRGMIIVNNVSYYMDEEGKMLSNTTFLYNGKEYNIDAQGAMNEAVTAAETSAPSPESESPSNTDSTPTAQINPGKVISTSIGPVAR